jgi:hypothetical protein
MGERRGEAHTRFRWGTLSESYHLEDSGLDWKIILKRIFKKRNGGMDWIDLAHNRDRKRAVVKAVINLRVL